MVACQGKEKASISVEALQEGEQLVRAHCQRCHRWPPPAVLDKKTWDTGVLPVMAHYLGVHETPYDELFEAGEAGQRVRQATIFPQEPKLSERDWQKIRMYYTHEAPDRLSVNVPEDTLIEPALFSAVAPEFSLTKPLVSMLASNGEHLVVGDVKRDVSQLSFLDHQWQPQYSVQVPEAPVQLIPTDDGFYVLCMGRMYPSDAAQGRLIKVKEEVDPTGRRHFRASLLLDQLQRPVQVAFADLDGDQDDDVVVCEFGYRTGKFGWYEQTNGKYRYHRLQNEAGAIQAVVQDFTGDHRPDLLVLFAQGDERFVLYTNRGNGKFSAKQLLRFLPVAGSTSFELTDWNEDGYPDILYTSGDNADHSPIVKPYHGITLFVNDGSNHFREAFFLEHPGAYQAHAADYDHDGDQDIAAISFFPDYARQPQTGFVFYQNDGQDQFTRNTFSQATRGRWIRMLSYDHEGDGDEDVLLGSFVGLPPSGDRTGLYEQWMEGKLPLLLLENRTN